MKQQPKQTCLNCGEALKPSQSKFCSKKCSAEHRYNGVPTLHKICPVCGDSFDTKSKIRIFCSTFCSDKGKRTRNRESYNRPYTPNTKSIIKLWYNNGKGNSKIEIAQILRRSLESVEKAFV